MTKKKARKRLVRQRAAKTGESYTAALRQLLASKEKSVTSTQDDPVTRCTLCAVGEGGPTSLVNAGLPFCPDCHDKLRSAARTHLEPEAARTGRPLDYFVSALVFVRKDDRYVVHLHTLQPGLVIGRRGVTADKIRQSLIEVTGDGGLRLNIVPHEFFGCPRQPEEHEGASG